MDTGRHGPPAIELSIVIPVLNDAPSLDLLLGRLAALRARATEIIVVDGGSSDGTCAAALGRANLILCAARGRALQMNAGASAAHGRILLFLHADSGVPAQLDRIVRAAIGERKQAWGRFDVRIDSRRRALRLIAAMMNLRSRMTAIATGDQGIFVTRALFEQVGGFPAQPLMEDIALSRTLKAIVRPTCLRERIVTSGRRWERHGIVRTVLLMWRMRLAYFCGADPAKLALRYEHVR